MPSIDDVKVIKKSKAPHKCFACLCTIPEGFGYLQQTVKGEAGKLESVRFCIECGYLMSQMDRETVKAGGFTERMIPNCLRKKRDAWRKEQFERMKNEN